MYICINNLEKKQQPQTYPHPQFLPPGLFITPVDTPCFLPPGEIL